MSVTLSVSSHMSGLIQMTDLQADGSDLILSNDRVVLNHISQRSSLHEFHHNPEFLVLFLQERVKEVDNVGVFAIFHDNDFVDNEFLARLVAKVHLLDGNLATRTMGTVDFTSHS